MLLNTGRNSLVAHHFEADGCLLADIQGSSCLGNPLIYLLPGHMSVSGILRSDLQSLQLLDGRLRKCYHFPIACSFFHPQLLKLLNVIHFMWSPVAALLPVWVKLNAEYSKCKIKTNGLCQISYCKPIFYIQFMSRKQIPSVYNNRFHILDYKGERQLSQMIQKISNVSSCGFIHFRPLLTISW